MLRISALSQVVNKHQLKVRHIEINVRNRLFTGTVLLYYYYYYYYIIIFYILIL